jgi:hypothetical protein
MSRLKEMSEQLHEALQESKRIDHLIFVSLKYTRTVDVIVSILERMINFFNFLVEALLEYYKEKGMVDVIQKSPGLKCDQLKGVSSDSKIHEMIDFYILLRRLVRIDRSTINEYKRHVAMVVKLDDGKELVVDIDLVTKYYEQIKGYLEYCNESFFKKAE